MRYLSLDEILSIHRLVMDIGGGQPGVLNIGLLLSALEIPKAATTSGEFYISIEEKAAVLLRSLIMNHAFIDGNKRTAYMGMMRFLAKNAYYFEASIDEALTLVVSIAKGELSVEGVVEWLVNHKV